MGAGRHASLSRRHLREWWILRCRAWRDAAILSDGARARLHRSTALRTTRPQSRPLSFVYLLPCRLRVGTDVAISEDSPIVRSFAPPSCLHRSVYPWRCAYGSEHSDHRSKNGSLESYRSFAHAFESVSVRRHCSRRLKLLSTLPEMRRSIVQQPCGHRRPHEWTAAFCMVAAYKASGNVAGLFCALCRAASASAASRAGRSLPRTASASDPAWTDPYSLNRSELQRLTPLSSHLCSRSMYFFPFVSPFLFLPLRPSRLCGHL